MLKFYIISTLIITVLFLSSACTMLVECRKTFTDTEWEIIKMKPKQIAWFIPIAVLMCPILNIALLIVMGLNYGEIRDDMINDYKKFLKNMNVGNVENFSIDFSTFEQDNHVTLDIEFITGSRTEVQNFIIEQLERWIRP